MPSYQVMAVKLQATGDDISLLSQIRRGDKVSVILQHTGYRDGVEAELRVTSA